MEQTKSVKLYRMVLITSIALNVGAGFFIMFWPDAFTNLFNQPEAFPDTWPRHWGWQLLAINALYMPGYWNPIVNRWPNYCGIVIRLSFALFFFSQGGGFVMMGVYDGISGLALLFAYLPVLKMQKRQQSVAVAV